MKYFTIALLVVTAQIHVGCEDPDFMRRVDPTGVIEEHNQEYLVQDFVSTPGDILWVIDNSGSMGAYQQQVIQNMNLFIRAFYQNARGANWRMGLLSTDISDGPYVGFYAGNRLDNHSTDPVAMFNNAVRRLGTSGSGNELSFRPIRQALTGHPDFLRANTKFFVIMISDEPEQSSMAVADFIAYLHTKVPAINLSTYGVFTMSENGCGSYRYQGSRYERFITGTNGVSYPICSQDFGTLLSAIGDDIGRKISYPKIVLNVRPKLESLQIFYLDKEIPGGLADNGGFWLYEYEENAIYFHDMSFIDGESTEHVRIVFDRIGSR